MILSTNGNDFPAKHILWSDIKINFMGTSIISQWMMHIGNNAGWKINEPNVLQFRFRNIRKIYLSLSNFNRFSMYPWYPTYFWILVTWRWYNLWIKSPNIDQICFTDIYSVKWKHCCLETILAKMNKLSYGVKFNKVMIITLHFQSLEGNHCLYNQLLF